VTIKDNKSRLQGRHSKNEQGFLEAIEHDRLAVMILVSVALDKGEYLQDQRKLVFFVLWAWDWSSVAGVDPGQ